MFAFAFSIMSARGGAHLGVVADVAVDHDHVLLGDVVVLRGRDPVELLAGHGLAAGRPVRRRRCCRRSGTATLVWTFMLPNPVEMRVSRHLLGERPQLLGGGIVVGLGPPVPPWRGTVRASAARAVWDTLDVTARVYPTASSVRAAIGRRGTLDRWTERTDGSDSRRTRCWRPIRSVLSGAGPEVRVGPGDDAAVVAPPVRGAGRSRPMRWSRACTSSGDRSTARDLGHKAIAVNVSDIAAMAGAPAVRARAP